MEVEYRKHKSMVNRLRRLRAVTRARGRWDPLQFNASLVVQPIAERATRLRQPERAFRDPPACFSLLRPARISPAPRRPVYLLLATLTLYASDFTTQVNLVLGLMPSVYYFISRVNLVLGLMLRSPVQLPREIWPIPNE